MLDAVRFTETGVMLSVPRSEMRSEFRLGLLLFMKTRSTLMRILSGSNAQFMYFLEKNNIEYVIGNTERCSITDCCYVPLHFENVDDLVFVKMKFTR
jgi:hypothetical protein